MTLINKFLDFFFPPICICCKRSISTSSVLPFCKECHSTLFSSKLKEPKVIYDDNIEKCYCLYQYKKYNVKKIIFHTKKIFSDRFKNFISKEMKDAMISHNLLKQVDLITFSPRKKSSINLYGIDQGEELAKCLSEATSIPFSKCILRKGKSSEQKFLKSAEREANVKNIFHFSPDADVKGKTVLIVDDVITTGATVKACAKILKENGAKAVYALSVAD